MPGSDDAIKAPTVIERFVRLLIVASKAVALYPPSSTIPRENAEAAVAGLDDALCEYPDVTLAVSKHGIFFEDAPVFPGQSAFASLGTDFYNRGLAVVRFHAGTTERDMIAFLTLLKYTPDEVASGGGFEGLLWEQGVSNITVQETHVTLVDAGIEAEAEGPAEGEDESQAPAIKVRRSTGPRSRESLELSRVAGSVAAIRDYLAARYDENGDPLSLTATESRFKEVAKIAADTPDGPARESLIRSFAEALWTLDPDLRGELLQNHMIQDAKTNEELAFALRSLDLGEIAHMLTDEADDENARRAGFVRALKNLSQISQGDRDKLVGETRRAMLAEGFSDEDVQQVITGAAPTKLTVRRRASTPRAMDNAASVVLQLIEQAPLAPLAESDSDPELVALREEAIVGITDGDVIVALVTVAGLESREAQFASVMSSLEDALGVLVARGEIEIAADTAMLLIEAARNPALSEAQRQRLENAVTRFARPEDIRGITHALRVYPPGSPEYEAARNLLDTLGALRVQPLLEQLAEETDRGERKALVDLISQDAEKYIPQLGTHVSDGRWYFVRNVVAILGSTRSVAVLPFLERTLRHPEPRVRRETIRALSLVTDRSTSVVMLVAALDDEDAHNVQLAARYLGLKSMRNAVPALERVAKGEGRGNRENGPRVEAIEALGRMGATEALPTLDAIVRKRSIIGGAKARELRAAAASATAAIQAKGAEQ